MPCEQIHKNLAVKNSFAFEYLQNYYFLLHIYVLFFIFTQDVMFIKSNLVSKTI